MDYDRDLFRERDLRSVTSNTRRDGEELLRLASRLSLTAPTTGVPFAQLDQAMADLAHGRTAGSLVMTINP